MTSSNYEIAAEKERWEKDIKIWMSSARRWCSTEEDDIRWLNGVVMGIQFFSDYGDDQ